MGAEVRASVRRSEATGLAEEATQFRWLYFYEKVKILDEYVAQGTHLVVRPGSPAP